MTSSVFIAGFCHRCDSAYVMLYFPADSTPSQYCSQRCRRRVQIDRKRRRDRKEMQRLKKEACSRPDKIAFATVEEAREQAMRMLWRSTAYADRMYIYRCRQHVHLSSSPINPEDSLTEVTLDDVLSGALWQRST